MSVSIQPYFHGAVHSCVAAGVEEQSPSIGVVVFPALCDCVVVAGQLQHLCIGVFPANSPAAMCPFEVGDGSKVRPIPCGILIFVPMAFQRFQSGWIIRFLLCLFPALV